MDSSYVVNDPLAVYRASDLPAADHSDMDLPIAVDDYSPVPDIVASQNSSPGSASDHMGIMPNLHKPAPDPVVSAAAAARTDASLNAPSWQSALELNVPRVVSTFMTSSDPDMVRSWNTASPITTSHQIMGSSNDSLAVASSSASSSPHSAAAATNSKPAAAHRRKPVSAKPKREPERRQKRLERNRESARLSRRRRKHYLEILEERVTQLSHDLDCGRREHVSKAVATVSKLRSALLENGPSITTCQPAAAAASLWHGPLSRASQELSIATTFLSQQLKSFSLPPSMSFVLWLTLQSETFFRGGRANSERLSAARIGERMLSSGVDRVSPAQSLWPLFCGEIGLSYEQEEKFRNCQRLTLQSRDVWVDRHTTFAIGKVIQSAHDATLALALRLGQRERSTLGILSDEQKKRLLQWSNRNRGRIAAATSQVPLSKDASPLKTSTEQHQAANIYILNHQLQSILQKVPRSAPLVTGPTLKKLSQRPCFESLGCRQGDDEKETSLERSHSSTGSLKRSASEMDMEGSEDRPALPSICPMEAQTAASPAIDVALGHVKHIIPPPPIPTTSMQQSPPLQFTMPHHQPPVTAASATSMSRCMSMPVAPVSYEPVALNSFSMQQQQQQHGGRRRQQQQSTFIPSHLNIVPEEMWPADAEDLLLNLVDEEDWAIGEGIDMDM